MGADMCNIWLSYLNLIVNFLVMKPSNFAKSVSSSNLLFSSFVCVCLYVCMSVFFPDMKLWWKFR